MQHMRHVAAGSSPTDGAATAQSSVVGYACPPPLAAHEEAEAVIERDLRFSLSCGEQHRRLYLDHLDAESGTVLFGYVVDLVQGVRQHGHPSNPPADILQNGDV